MNVQEFQDSLTSYPAMSRLLKTSDYQTILQNAAALGSIAPEVLEQHPMGGYSKGMTSGAYAFVLQDLLKNVAQYDWVFEHLEDDTSRLVFANLIGYRLFPAQSFLKAAYDEKNPQYFDREIVSCNENEVFVDCGGFTGDTVESYIREFGVYKRIYTYEPSSENVQECRKNLEKYPNVEIRPYGVGEKTNFLAMDSDGSSATFMQGKAAADSSSGVRIVSLDEDIREPITFLKMDVEGFEIPALLGAKRHIRDDFPKLAICTYHIVSDMWEIPRLIDTIHPGYRFYIRHYDFPQNWETVLYAIPSEKEDSHLKKSNKGRKTVVALTWSDGWENAELVKDCGVIPYLLHKNHSCDVSMLGGRRPNEKYTKHKYIPGVKMEFLPDGSLQAKVDYLIREAKNIDCLEIYGCYPDYFPLVDIYKALNPQGKIFAILDANSAWMDRIQWAEPNFQKFLDQCDVLGASSRSIQNHLNQKWPCIIDLVPRGFYKLIDMEWKPSFQEKRNVILTVSRLGTPQKATNVLLEAFAAVADRIPDWELRLEGNIADEFQDYLTRFKEENPELQARIHFLGRLPEKEALYKEYLDAKIFAISSVMEGGIPNVIAEALAAGDVIATTKIDGYMDATDQGRCGMWSEIGDIDGFAAILLQLCTSKNLEQMSRRACEYAKEDFDMERVAARVYQMIFGGEN